MFFLPLSESLLDLLHMVAAVQGAPHDVFPARGNHLFGQQGIRVLYFVVDPFGTAQGQFGGRGPRNSTKYLQAGLVHGVDCVRFKTNCLASSLPLVEVLDSNMIPIGKMAKGSRNGPA